MKKFMFAALAGLAFPLMAADGPNLIKNPGFEEDGEWRVWGSITGMSDAEKQTKMVYDTTTFASGKRSLKVIDDQEKFSPYVIQFVPLETPAASYRLTFKAKAEEGAEFRAGAMFNKGTPAKHEYLGSADKPFRGNGEWKEYTVDIKNLKEGTNLLAVLLAPCKWGEGYTGTVWFDDVSLVAVE